MKYLVAGLGNIGEPYRGTRHNVGFDIADELAAEAGVAFTLEKYALRATLKYKGRQIVLIKPTTFMNLSGRAVEYWLKKESVDRQHLLVLVDDLALPFGTVRIKGRGSDGGHNGLRDIQAVLQTTSYARLRFGIGDSFPKGRQVDYVLGKWGEQELQELPARLAHAAEAVKSFCAIGLEHTMNAFNNK